MESRMSEPTALTTDEIKAFVLAAHGNLDKVKELLAEHPDLLNVVYDWGAAGGLGDAIGAAGHMGRRDIAVFLLAQGASNNNCIAAMLGQGAQTKTFLDKSKELGNGRGAHGIPVMFSVPE